MKKTIILTVLAILAGATCANAEDIFTPNAAIYSNISIPYSKYFDSSVKPVKKGEATCKNFFFIAAIGNCSIAEAMENGNITKIHSIDKENKNIILYQKSTIVVHGE